MSNRTMVKLTARQYGIELWTYSREKKSRSFFVLRDELAELSRRDEIIVHDGSSYATFRRDLYAGTVGVRFAWLSICGDRLSGWEETLELPYAPIMEFAESSREAGGPKHCRLLAVKAKTTQPRFIFCDVQRLHECLAVKDVRRKLVRFLRDNFRWPDSEEIRFYSDFDPYSFFFQEIRRGQTCLSGGLILHRQENLDRAYYSIHT